MSYVTVLSEKVRIAIAAGPQGVLSTHPGVIRYGKKRESAREFAERIALLAVNESLADKHPRAK